MRSCKGPGVLWEAEQRRREGWEAGRGKAQRGEKERRGEGI